MIFGGGSLSGYLSLLGYGVLASFLALAVSIAVLVVLLVVQRDVRLLRRALVPQQYAPPRPGWPSGAVAMRWLVPAVYDPAAEFPRTTGPPLRRPDPKTPVSKPAALAGLPPGGPPAPGGPVSPPDPKGFGGKGGNAGKNPGKNKPDKPPDAPKGK